MSDSSLQPTAIDSKLQRRRLQNRESQKRYRNRKKTSPAECSLNSKPIYPPTEPTFYDFHAPSLFPHVPYPNAGDSMGPLGPFLMGDLGPLVSPNSSLSTAQPPSRGTVEETDQGIPTPESQYTNGNDTASEGVGRPAAFHRGRPSTRESPGIMGASERWREQDHDPRSLVIVPKNHWQEHRFPAADNKGAAGLGQPDLAVQQSLRPQGQPPNHPRRYDSAFAHGGGSATTSISRSEDKKKALGRKRLHSPSSSGRPVSHDSRGKVGSTSKAVQMIQDVQDLHRFGVMSGLLDDNSDFGELLEEMKSRFATLAPPSVPPSCDSSEMSLQAWSSSDEG